MNKDKSLDILRGLAISLVLIYHVYQSFFRGYAVYEDKDLKLHWPAHFPPSLDFVNEFHFGVNLFFILSGFLIHYIYKDRVFNKKNALTFFLKRVWRIIPAYYLAVIISVMGGAMLGRYSFDLWDILSHFLFLHNFFYKFSYSIQAVFWSIAVEMQFYLLYLILRLITINYNNKRHLWLIISTLFLLLSIATKVNLIKSFTNAEDIRWTYLDNTLARFPEWLLGLLAAEYYVLLSSFFKRHKVIFFTLIPLLFGTGFLTSFHLYSYIFVSDLAYSSAFILILAWFREAKFNNTYLERLGIVSFSCYLFHFLAYSIWDVALTKILHIERVANMERGIIMILSIPLVIFISSLFYRFIEKPSMAIGKKYL